MLLQSKEYFCSTKVLATLHCIEIWRVILNFLGINQTFQKKLCNFSIGYRGGTECVFDFSLCTSRFLFKTNIVLAEQN